MFAIHKTIKSPQRIDFCVEAVFTDPSHINLITVANNNIHIYRVVHDARLSFVSKHLLHGKITSIEPIRTSRHIDYLILSFEDAKVPPLLLMQMSIIEYIPHSNDISTVSLHYFEREDFKVIHPQLTSERSHCPQEQVKGYC
jgi:hypothetical protein